MTKRSSVTSAASFKSALRTVKADLKGLGFWSKKLADINVRQTLWGLAYGWQYYRGSGDIVIPKLSIIRWFNTACYGDTFPVRDVIRHEYGHAVADCHRGIIRSAKFRDAFGMSHDDDSSSEYDDEDFVTYYASDNAGEDFAETFMYYVKHKGRIPANFDTPTIKKKWEFIKHVGCCLEEAV
tara:strand:+ start:1306 stop:1851 length:546 start_codon:yes stop_codon:yes gene_type:complete